MLWNECGFFANQDKVYFNLNDCCINMDIQSERLGDFWTFNLKIEKFDLDVVSLIRFSKGWKGLFW